MQPTQPQPWRDILGGRTSVETCLQQLLRVAKPVAALQIVKERLAVATTEGEGVRVCAVGENRKTRQMERESISMHCALQQWTVKGTDCRHQPSAQDMDAKPVATRREARVAAQTQGVVPGQSYLAAVRRLVCRSMGPEEPTTKGRRPPSGGSDSVLCTWPAWLRLGRAPWLNQPSKG